MLIINSKQQQPSHYITLSTVECLMLNCSKETANLGGIMQRLLGRLASLSLPSKPKRALHLFLKFADRNQSLNAGSAVMVGCSSYGKHSFTKAREAPVRLFILTQFPDLNIHKQVHAENWINLDCVCDVPSSCSQFMDTPKVFQGKGLTKAICHCLPLHSDPGILWESPIQILTMADPA